MPILLYAVNRLVATGIELSMTDQDSPFQTAWTRQLGEQALINNIPKEALNALTRIIGTYNHTWARGWGDTPRMWSKLM